MSTEFKSDKGMDNIFKGPEDYYDVAEVIKNLYMSDSALQILMDFSRTLDELDVFAYKNWLLGELVEGPTIGRYDVSCIFLWPEHLMPDPRAGKRLLPFGCKVRYKKTTMQVPVKVEDPDDFRPNTKKPRIIEKPIWLVEIVIQKDLMDDIQAGSVEVADETIDLADLDLAYEEDLEDQEQKNEDIDEFSDEMERQSDDEFDELEL